jgi:predicted  nucleic acid-binding Zn-ribbon protein
MAEQDEPEEGSSGGSRAAGCLIKLVSHGVVGVAGLVLGMIIPVAWEQFQNPEVMASPEADFSRAELIAKLDAQEKAYQELLDKSSKLDTDQKAQLTQAATKVVDLQGSIAKKEEEIALAQAKLKKTAGQSAARKKELEAKEKELEDLRAQLTQAIQEKEQLTQQLEVSHQETAAAREETAVAKQETENEKAEGAWARFQGESLMKVCEKGSAKKMGNCRSEVQSALNEWASRFKGCVLSHQATPRMLEVEDKRDFSLPTYSEWLSQESKFSKDKFYIVFCDPSLPEAPGADDPL